MATGITATSELYWLSAALLSLVDLTAVVCLSQCVPAALFRRARSEIVLAAVLFWGGLWTALMASSYVWQSCYCYFFTNVDRWLMPPLMALLFGAVGYGMWWVSNRVRWHPAVTFALLGALVSLPDHYYAILVKGVLNTPLMSEVSPASAYAFGIFEFVFYWILILSLGLLLQSLADWWAQGHKNLFNHLLRPGRP